MPRFLAPALALGLLLWSLVGNLLLGDMLYVTRNLVLTALVLVVARWAEAEPAILGTEAARLGAGLRWGLAAVLVVTLAVLLGVVLAERVPGADLLLADERAELSTSTLVRHALWRIPVGTALFEEVAFRGVLLGLLLRRTSTVRAVAGSSLVFGLWHVAPTMVALEINEVAVTSWQGAATIAGAVGVTTVAGVLFGLLRLGSGSLLAPVLAHWATNGTGLVAAWVADVES